MGKKKNKAQSGQSSGSGIKAPRVYLRALECTFFNFYGILNKDCEANALEAYRLANEQQKAKITKANEKNEAGLISKLEEIEKKLGDPECAKRSRLMDRKIFYYDRVRERDPLKILAIMNAKCTTPTFGILDLHNLPSETALYIVRAKLLFLKNLRSVKLLTVITGKGGRNHPNPKIKTGVQTLSDNLGLPCEEVRTNAGRLQITIDKNIETLRFFAKGSPFDIDPVA